MEQNILKVPTSTQDSRITLINLKKYNADCYPPTIVMLQLLSHTASRISITCDNLIQRQSSNMFLYIRTLKSKYTTKKKQMCF
mmetsp:Transcript_16536/g.23504  ORF Transcript_16536/g.23504 Transcript_16536/m.23504 type:complete len:83 (-) Transcript_16536:6-254(-)